MEFLQQRQVEYDNLSKSFLESFRAISDLASTGASGTNVNTPENYFSKSQSNSSQFLGLEWTPLNALFVKTAIISFFVQIVLFYLAWWARPSFSQNRRGLAWVLTFGSACWLLFTCSFEIGYLRTPLWSYLGWEQSGSDTTIAANIFSYWLPSFYSWASQLGINTNNISLDNFTLNTLLLSLTNVELAKMLLFNRSTYEALAGEYLRWFMGLPIFSLSPLSPPKIISETAPYYFGGGGRLILSLENFPRESIWSSLLCGYFLAYCAADLVLGWIHYRKYVDPASGYLHHIIYSWLIWRLAHHRQLSAFLVCGGPLEVSTVFLASGFMFPQLREDFWFPLSFILVRIVFVAFMLHEAHFNFQSSTGGSLIYFLALLMHVYWINKYFQGLSHRTHQAQKELQKERQQKQRQQQLEKKAQEQEEYKGQMESVESLGDSEINSHNGSLLTTAINNTTFQLRAKNTKNRE